MTPRRLSPLIVPSLLACAAAQAAAAPRLPELEALQFRHETAANGVAFDARWSGDGSRLQARASTLREPDGRIVASTRAWWQTDMPEVASSLRLGSQQAAASLIRNAVDLSGLGLAGRLVPLLADYAVMVGRQEPMLGMPPSPTLGETTGFASVRRAIGNGVQLGLQAMRLGPWHEVGAWLDGIALGPLQQRLGVVETRDETQAQQRLVFAQQWRLGGVMLLGRAEQVVEPCTAPVLLPVPSTMLPACSAWRGDAQLPLGGDWRLNVGSGVLRNGDDSLLRQATLGTIWQLPSGPQFRLSLQHEDSGATQRNRVEAALAWSYGRFKPGFVGR